MEKLNLKEFLGNLKPIISKFDNIIFADNETYEMKMRENQREAGFWREATERETKTYIFNSYNLPWKRKKVFYMKMFNNNTGYGKLSSMLEEALSNDEIQKILSLDGSEIAFICTSVWSLEAGKLLQTVKKQIEKAGTKQRLVVYTMWETEKWHELHIHELNYADMVIVPSQWCKSTLIDSGYKGQVEILPCPLTTEFHYSEKTKNDKFRFLTYNGGDMRKGFPLYLEAFLEEFEAEKDVEYLVKTTNNDVFERNVNKFRADKKLDNVKFYFGNYQKDKMQEILDQADCFVFPSSGEGWGYTPLESVVAGIPCILPKAHSFIDHWNSAYIEVKATKTKANFQALDDKFIKEDIGDWYLIDKKDLKKQMRKVYEDWKNDKRDIWNNAKKESPLIVDKYSIDQTSQKLSKILCQKF